MIQIQITISTTKTRKGLRMITFDMKTLVDDKATQQEASVAGTLRTLIINAMKLVKKDLVALKEARVAAKIRGANG